MFLLQLYRTNKWLVIAFVIWLVAFLVVNYKWGMVAGPVYQYGMFSKPMHLSESKTAYRIVVNGKPIQPALHAFAGRDVLYLSLERYVASEQQNKKVMHAMQPYLPAVRPGDMRFYSTLSGTEFLSWYAKRIYQVTGTVVRSLEIYEEQFTTEKDGKVLIHASQKLNFD